jgi:hypothetical protein
MVVNCWAAHMRVPWVAHYCWATLRPVTDGIKAVGLMSHQHRLAHRRDAAATELLFLLLLTQFQLRYGMR